MISFLLSVLLLFQAPAGLQANAGVVTGILRTDAGLPLAGVRVAVSHANEAAGFSVLESLGESDSSGRYRLENVSPGRYNILVGRSGQSSYHPGVAELGRATTIQVLAGSTVEVPVMVVKGGQQVSGHVVDMATGKGRPRARLVLCCDFFQPVIMANPNTVAEAGTFAAYVSDDGSFVIPLVPPGNYALSTVDPDLTPVSWALAVGEKAVTGLQLDVSEGIEVEGTVLDQNGAPVTAAVRMRSKPTNSELNTIGAATSTSSKGPVFFSKADSSLDYIRNRIQKVAKVHSQTTGPDGRFSFKNVYPGTYLLDVTTSGITILEREIQVANAGPTNASHQVPVNRITGRVVTAGGDPLPRLNYIRIVRSGTDTEVFYGFPDAEGRFSLLLAPGQYRVFTENLGPSVQSVSDGSRDISNTEFTFEGSRNSQIVVTIQP
jgi:hypothetical protein